MRTATKPQAKTTHFGDALAGQVLVDADWLHARLDESSVVVIEVDVSAASYGEGHVDGAILWNVYTDLKDDDFRLRRGRELHALFARSGITPDSTIVFYGYAPALGYWLLQHLGYTDLRVLDCSRQTWMGEGRPWSVSVPAPVPVPAVGSATAGVAARPQSGRITPGSGGSNQASVDEVRVAIGDLGIELLDVRTKGEYDGACFWPSGGPQPDGRAGHVPTARHFPLPDLYDARGAFLPRGQLREAFAPVIDEDIELITYCTIGGRASTAWFVMSEILGRAGVRVYEGSWAEWGRTPGLPVETRTG